MKQIARRSLARNTKAATALEFALVSVVLIALLIGGMELGIVLWTRGTLQSIAAQTARCAALSSPLWPYTRAYAVSQAEALLGLGLDPKVTVTTGPTCANASASNTTFAVVTISASVWFGSMFGPLGPSTETVTACYPI